MQEATPDAADPAVLFDAGRQAVKVRFMMLLSVACAAGALYWGVDLVRSYGLAPADGGVLAPLWQRAALGLFVGGLGVAFAFGMWVYGRHYVLDARVVPETGRLRLRTLTFLGSDVHDVDPADVQMGKHHAGRLSVPDASNPWLDKFHVDAPWVSVHVKGRRWPLVLDLHGNLRRNLHADRGADARRAAPHATVPADASSTKKRPRRWRGSRRA